MQKTLLLVFAIAILSGCTATNVSQNQTNNMEKINFTTSDGWTIVANYWNASGNAVVLLHQLGGDKSSFTRFANELNSQGYAVVALDFRGHGESTNKNGKTTTWENFTYADFNNMTKDVAAARDWLANKGYDKFAIVGASIGGNIAINYAVNDSAMKTVFLLSAGLDYKGVTINQTIRNFTKPVFIVASNEDTYSARSSTILWENAQGKKEIKLFDNAGHGTQMFDGTDLDRLILIWLKNNLI